MTNHSDKFPEFLSLVKTLASSAWKDANIDAVKIDRWLNNFRGVVATADTEMHHAFHLLSQLIYFGENEINECLRILFQEKLAYQFVQEQKKNGLNSSAIYGALLGHLRDHVRFVGVGSASESGTSFLYPFRKANGIPTQVCSSLEKVVNFGMPAQAGAAPPISFSPSTLTEIIYLDDFCATGQQVESREGAAVKAIRASAPSMKVHYFIIFATNTALSYLRSLNLFDRVEAAIVFDDDYKAFSLKSHFYRTPHQGIDQATGKLVMEHYGRLVESDPQHILGYRGSEMLVSFKHNTPDNSLPTIWKENSSLPWHPIFRRIEKLSFS